MGKYTALFQYIHAYTYMHARTHACMHACVRACVQASRQTNRQASRQTNRPQTTDKHTHTHIYMDRYARYVYMCSYAGQDPDGCLHKLGVLFVGASTTKSPNNWGHIRACDFWKLPDLPMSSRSQAPESSAPNASFASAELRLRSMAALGSRRRICSQICIYIYRNRYMLHIYLYTCNIK